MTKQRRGKQAGNPKKAMPHFLIRRISEGSFILVMTVALFVLLSLSTYQMNDSGPSHAGLHSAEIANGGGQVGAYVADALYFFFGYMAYLLPVYFAYIAWVILKDHRALRVVNKSMLLLRGAGLLFLLCGGCGLLAFGLYGQVLSIFYMPGGVLGQSIAGFLYHVLNLQGAILLLFAMLLVGVTWLTGLSWIRSTEVIGYYIMKAVHVVVRSLLVSLRLIKSAWMYFKARKKKKALMSNRCAPGLAKIKKDRFAPLPSVMVEEKPSSVKKK